MLVSESQKVGIAAGKILLGRNCLKRDSSVSLFSFDAGLRSSALCHPCRFAQWCILDVQVIGEKVGALWCILDVQALVGAGPGLGGFSSHPVLSRRKPIG